MIEYVREMNKNYIKITPEEEMKQAYYGMKMVENNHIDGLLPLKALCVNNRTSYLYEISGRISLEEKYSTQEFSAADIEYIAEYIKGMLAVAERYMLDADGLLFEPKYIFCNVGDGLWQMIYCTVTAKEVRKGLRSLFEFILNRLDHKEPRCVIVGYGLYKRVCQEDIELEKLFDFDMPEEGILGGAGAEPEYHMAEKVYADVVPAKVTEEYEEGGDDISGWLRGRSKLLLAAGALLVFAAFLLIVMGVVPDIIRISKGGAVTYSLAIKIFLSCVFAVPLPAGVYLYKKRDGADAKIETRDVSLPYSLQLPNIFFDKKTEGAEGDNPTVLISGEGLPALRRVKRKNETGPEEEYILKESPICMGSGAQADVLLNYEGISRIHARISKEGEMWFIKDMNSTNGTWVNEKRLSVYELCPLRQGDIIKLADTSFELVDIN